MDVHTVGHTMCFHLRVPRPYHVRSDWISSPRPLVLSAGWHVLLTTYEVAGIEENALVKVPWQYLVIDEVGSITGMIGCVASFRERSDAAGGHCCDAFVNNKPKGIIAII